MTTQSGEVMIMESSRCEDCGNQAKKECAFRRCRTCCKNKGFKCQTHVSSTWIPLQTRRHLRLHPQLDLHQQNPKRTRPAIPDSSESKFPVEVNSMAVFRCLRVSSFHGGGDHYAYQTSVSIGGHVFTGILYDQGHQNNYTQPNNSSSSSSSLLHHPLLSSSVTISPASLPPPFSIHTFSPSTLNFPTSKS